MNVEELGHEFISLSGYLDMKTIPVRSDNKMAIVGVAFAHSFHLSRYTTCEPRDSEYGRIVFLHKPNFGRDKKVSSSNIYQRLPSLYYFIHISAPGANKGKLNPEW